MALHEPSVVTRGQSAADEELMDARRLIAFIKREGRSDTELMAARAKVDAAKIELGERGAVWWYDGAPDFNRRMVKNTPYQDWYTVAGQGGAAPS